MQKIFLAQAAAILIAFSSVILPVVPTRALAANSCDAGGGQAGFKVGGHTFGSVVTLCAKYVADQTTVHSVSPGAGRSAPKPPHKAVKPAKPSGAAKPLDAKAKLWLLRRRLALQANNSFSPNPLLIRSSPNITKLGQSVTISVKRNRQFRIAYLLSRFVAVRFTPIKITFHFDSTTRPKYGAAPFGASVRFFSTGFHTIRAIVTYRAEYRVAATKVWQKVAGEPALAALPARVFVVRKPSTPRPPAAKTKRAYLVADDCLSQLENVGCLN